MNENGRFRKVTQRWLAASLGAVTILFFSLGPLQAQQSRKPNVLFIFCDDLNDAVGGGGMGGHPQARTPNIDRLIRSGVRFTNDYSAAPICTALLLALASKLFLCFRACFGVIISKDRLPQRTPMSSLC